MNEELPNMANGNENRTVNLNDYAGSDSKEALKLEHLNGARHAILTIQDARAVRVPDGSGGTRNAFVIEFQEFPDLAFWANKQDLTALVERYGNDASAWEGSPVPMTTVVVTNPKTRVDMDALHVVRPLDWDAALSAGGAKGNRGSAVKRAAKKGAAKKGAKRGKARGK